MKQAKPAPRKTVKTANKTVSGNKRFQTVDEYIASLLPATQTVMKELRKIIRQAAPQAEEVISYNIASFKQAGGLIWYGGWKEHVSMYPWNDQMANEIKGLAAYTASKGTIKFPIDKPLPAALITKVIKYRLRENLEKAVKK